MVRKKKKTIMSCNEAVIFARVSSREQEQGQSIDAQLTNLRTYCARKNLTIIKEYSITESSTRGNRKKFEEMLEYVKSRRYKTIIVADCIDRIQRSFKESIVLGELANSGLIEIHFVREALQISDKTTNCDTMRWDYGVLAAKTYVGNMRENVKRSMEFNINRGIIQWRAPLGYLNQKDEYGCPIAVIDPVRGPIIKRMFEEYATGLHSLNSIQIWAKDNGLLTRGSEKIVSKPANRAVIHAILRNPFYYGLMYVNDELKKHPYEPLIDKMLFDKVQDILTGKSHIRSKRGYGEIAFAFRGLMKCANCGCTISPEKKIKPNGKEYTYLKCSHMKHNCTQKPTNEKVILEQLQREVFEPMNIPESVLRAIKSKVQDSLKEQLGYTIKTKTFLQSEVQDKTVYLDRLLDAFVIGGIDKEVYEAKRISVQNEIAEAIKKLEKYEKCDVDVLEMTENVMEIAKNASCLMESPNVEQKRAILSLILSDCRLEHNKLLYSLKKPFDFLSKTNGCLFWQPQPDSNRCSRLERAVS